MKRLGTVGRALPRALGGAVFRRRLLLGMVLVLWLLNMRRESIFRTHMLLWECGRPLFVIFLLVPAQAFSLPRNMRRQWLRLLRVKVRIIRLLRLRLLFILPDRVMALIVLLLIPTLACRWKLLG